MVISLRLPDDLGVNIKALAESEHRSMNSLIVALLWQAVRPESFTVHEPVEAKIKPTAKTLADSIPVVTVASEVALRPKHSANCSCFICRPPKEDGR